MQLTHNTSYFTGLKTVVVLCFLLISCDSKKTSGTTALAGELAEGQKLALKYCSTCHLPVDPTLLGKETWKNQVLPAMAKQLGLEVWQKNHYFQNERSTVSQGDWMKIVAYYDSLAPEILPQSKPVQNTVIDKTIFSFKFPSEDTNILATTTLVAINKADHHIYTSTADNADLLKWNTALKKSLVSRLPSPATGILFHKDRNIITLIGEMKAIDNPVGTLVQLETAAGPAFTSLTSNLIRPVQTVDGDFNRDGLTDYVVCSFGHNKGGLYLIRQLPGNTFEKIAIREVAGATQALTGDFNQDGWPDVMALFAHADEGIWLFLNDQKGGFKEENILRFPPVYGSSSFQLTDMNKDGKLDIVYTAGDNSDYSRILKPYHGVYIYINKGDLNEGNSKFEKAGFYPVHGATKVIAKDFDLDGDTDLAAIAFFADFKNNPSESFIYFEQNSTKAFPDFTLHNLSINKYGRWICMDAEDMDGDGDVDIVLGNYSKGFLNQENFKPDRNEHLPFTILENKVK